MNEKRGNRGGRRPWRVFVHNIGPGYSFATEENATLRARRLTEIEKYDKVTVTNFDAPLEGWERSVYRWTKDGILTYREVWEKRPALRPLPGHEEIWAWYYVPDTKEILPNYWTPAEAAP